jgi:hypothetical protein
VTVDECVNLLEVDDELVDDEPVCDDPAPALAVTVLDVVIVRIDVVTPPSASVNVLVLNEMPVVTYVLTDAAGFAVPVPELPQWTRAPASTPKRQHVIRVDGRPCPIRGAFTRVPPSQRQPPSTGRAAVSARRSSSVVCHPVSHGDL